MSVHRPWSHRIELPAQPMGASQARAFVAQHMNAHGIAHLTDDVQLVASELATNAILHAQTPFTVILAASEEAVRLEVLDGSHIEPQLVVARMLETNGRGMAIMQALTQRWGVTDRPSGGKSVWALFDIPDTPTPPS